MVKLWLWIDTGGSGHGTVAREFMKHLLPHKKQVELAVYTHQWGFPFKVTDFTSLVEFPDSELAKELIESNRINEDYLLSEPREIRERKKNLLNDVVTMTQKDNGKYLMLKDFEGKEDISMAIGGIDMARGLPRYSKFSIVETCFNPSKIPDTWTSHGDYLDEVWLPNEWNKSNFLANPLLNYEDKLVVMPYGIDFPEPKPSNIDKLNDDTFTFVCAARWSNMKAWDVLIDAYLEEFKKDEKVRLFVKTTLNQQVELDDNAVFEAIQKVVNKKGIPDAPEIGINTAPYSYQEMFNLYGACDCAVLPHRAEGVGRFQAESMGAGLPVITTDWSGPTEFINSKNSFPLKHSEPEQVKKKCDWLYFYENEFGEEAGNEGIKWVEPDVEHLRELMRKVFEMSKEKREAIGKKASATVREHFDWDRCITARIKRLNEVV